MVSAYSLGFSRFIIEIAAIYICSIVFRIQSYNYNNRKIVSSSKGWLVFLGQQREIVSFQAATTTARAVTPTTTTTYCKWRFSLAFFFSSVFRFALVSQHFATEQRKSRGKCLSLAEIGESLSQLNNSMSAMWPLHIFFGSMTERNLWISTWTDTVGAYFGVQFTYPLESAMIN